MKKYIILFLTFILLVGCTSNKENNTDQESIETTGSSPVVIANNLFIPWTINKDGNTFYLSQREGSVIKVNGEDGAQAKQSLSLTKNVLHTGEGGFLGFILAPDFETSKEAYAYHTYLSQNQILNRVIVIRLEGNTWIEEDILLEGIPGGTIHNGGRLKIGPDGKLYVTTGDAANPSNSQNVQNLGGKILRMNLDGSIPGDNPFANSYVYSYGHRNPQGLAWDSSGQLYSTEHGQRAHDEINLIKPGQNYGWPVIQGDEEAPNMVKPIYHTGDETWAPSGIAFYKDTLYIATLRGQKLIAMDLSNLSSEMIFNEGGRLRDVLIDNGNLYAITNNRDGRGTPKEDDDKLIRFTLTN